MINNTKNIEFIDLRAQQEIIRHDIEASILKVLDHGHYIMGPEVSELEDELSKFCGVKYAISCSNGTDAIVLALMAKRVGSGDAVIVPSFTYVATAEAVVKVGAIPIFVDVLPDTFNMSSESLQEGIDLAKQLGLNLKGIITVDLFGQPADYNTLQQIADHYKLWIIADAAQGFGASYNGKMVGNITDITTTSFFPAKPLGCYGDGGAVFTNCDQTAALIKSFRIHGKGKDKYDNVEIGMNGRLDTIQAAILLEKLKIFNSELKKRQQVADIYTQGLKQVLTVPKLLANTTSAWAQYTLQIEPSKRDSIVQYMQNKQVPIQVYYVKPIHQQLAYLNFPKVKNLSISEHLSQSVFSLPMHPYLREEQQQYIIENLKETLFII
ncbi:degT/DnrJ/EryC1/StrS aminotransferase family protein [endosymbiont of Acanthamoeba sp. UWC8]|uniref:DegT/DnrJ/EryC1/StrS family aminotransferase n=1 Tax=endosymbiont of Acanthamoeba sp. UWC8 TaxID=86106 RepID=UPI0004D0FB67|nr:DegT/DnrJ/EryC1/StrS aminotransferase family protein [endosymbiont of Acanthamoeba sp. UWC8]AIF82010.1 degT/DnrJ/EryC1/StrS aminotransferase family protein [endosymbiont of Acanthamoeba sp. UWC8]